MDMESSDSNASCPATAYVQRVLEQTEENNPGEPEFLQAVNEVFGSILPVVERHPEYEKAALLERMVEPERTIEFRVTWMDDAGKWHVNRGYRVQFNGSLGPYKGGLRFHPSVNLSIIKFLGFEQVFKNALTTLPIGGAKGGSDFDPAGKSDGEIMRFCQAFMTELYRHIGPDTDVPAGDIGVGSREIGYLYGQYRRIRDRYDSAVLTGKDPLFGGSLLRPEATGYGVLYYAQEVLHTEGEELSGKTFAVSGYGNVAWGVAKKIRQLGGKLLTISGSDGYIYDPDGISTDEKIDYLLTMRKSGRHGCKAYADKFGACFFPGEKPWKVQADICIPSATQNEVTLEEARHIAENGTRYYFEAANMPTTPEAQRYLQQQGVIVGPSKAVNAGGVLVSALEMAQDSMRISWTAEEVDARLSQIMRGIVRGSYEAAKEYGCEKDLVRGGNIAAFLRVAGAMLKQGIF